MYAGKTKDFVEHITSAVLECADEPTVKIRPVSNLKYIYLHACA